MMFFISKSYHKKKIKELEADFTGEDKERTAE